MKRTLVCFFCVAFHFCFAASPGNNHVLDICSDSSMPDSLKVVAFQNIVHTYIKAKNYPQARRYADDALRLAKTKGKLNIAREAYAVLAVLDSVAGNYRASFDDYKYYVLYRDSIKKEENTKKVISEQIKLEFDKKQALEKAEQDKKDAVTEQERKKQLVIRNLFIVGFLLLMALAFFILKGYRQKQKTNLIITKQKEEVEHQKELVEEKQKEILDSIHYAQRIQKALLASDDLLSRNLSNYFVLYKPKDIVSGDFYWATNKEGRFYLAVCDSTGHGVPGAFMGLLNSSFLNEAITEKNISSPEKIFNHVRAKLIENVSRDGGRDGMDGVLVNVEKNGVGIKLKYAAAYNEPVVVRNGISVEMKADKMPVGQGEKMDSFTLHEMNLEKGDMLYLFTDGYADQFGGPKGKKFKYKQLLETLVAISSKEPTEQKKKLDEVFGSWKGNLEQVDDVLIIGIRV